MFIGRDTYDKFNWARGVDDVRNFFGTHGNVGFGRNGDVESGERAICIGVDALGRAKRSAAGDSFARSTTSYNRLDLCRLAGHSRNCF